MSENSINRKSSYAVFAPTLIVAALAGSAVMAQTVDSGGVMLTRDASIGTKYGAPGPRTCSTASLPESSAITPEQARAYIICAYEKDYQGDGQSLYLIGQVQVQIGAGRAYEHVRDSLQDIDPHKSVFDIRGSSVKYSCIVPGSSSILTNAQQCSRTVEQHDEGKCYQTTFNEWRCTWSDFYAPMSTDTRLRVGVPNVSEVD